MRVVLAAFLLGATVAAVAPAQFAGVIIDAECARGGHAAMRMAPTDAECARACVLSHDSTYLLEDGANLYRLSDQKAAEKFAAQRVIVVGSLDDKTRTIHVKSIAAEK